MNEMIEAFKLSEEGKHEEAYEKLTLLIENKEISIDARYSRAMLDISKVKKHLTTTIEDFHYLINKKTKYYKIAHSFLTFIYDELDQIDNTIKFARISLKLKTPFVMEIKFALARALARTNNVNNLNESLELINYCLTNEDDSEFMSYMTCKCDVLISLNKFELAKKTIDQLVTDFGHSGLSYYLKARLAMKMHQIEKNNEYLEDAIGFAKIALQYEEEDYSSKLILIEAYTLNKQYDLALKMIDSMSSYNTEEDIIMEKIKVYDEAKDYNKGLELIQEFLKNEESWKLTYMEGAFTLEVNQTDDGRKYARECFKKAYLLFPNNGIMYDIIKLNRTLNDEENSYDFLNQVSRDKPNGVIYFCLAEVSYRLEKDYGEINEYYKKSFEYGYIEENEYLDSICNYTKVPNELNKRIKKLEQINLKSEYVWSRRKTAIRYIYKEDGYKQNLKKAKKIIEECIGKFGDDPCTLSLMARCLDLNKDYVNAVRYYEKAYEIINQKEEVECDCTFGYYTHAIVEGLIKNKNLEDAKKSILKAINVSGKFVSSHVACYYAYFYLFGDERFDGNYAKYLLEINYPFYRYDISRIIMLNAVCKKLQVKSSKLNELLMDIDKYPREDIKYFNQNINLDIPKPYWRNI